MLLNVSALITEYETVGDHTEFIIQISCNGGLWLISRRFSDFDQLHARLIRCFGDLIEAHLPEKQWFGRFDPNFLAKRQSKLQEYLDSLLLVPGILDDRSLLHFLELEKHLDLHGDLLMGGGENGSSLGPEATKSALLRENDRLSAIIESAAQAFIDISEVPEPMDPEQASHRQQEILAMAQNTLSEQKFMEQFDASISCMLQLPKPCASAQSSEFILNALQDDSEVPASYDTERNTIITAWQSVADSVCLQFTTSSETDLIAMVDYESSKPSNSLSVGSNGNAGSGDVEESSNVPSSGM